MFDGISVAQQALKEMRFDLEYYASEVDKHAYVTLGNAFNKEVIKHILSFAQF